MNERGAYQKKAQNLANVEARHALLIAGLKSPERVSQSVAKAMEGQRAFCALTLSGSKIEPISLNTLKSLTSELYRQHESAEGNGFRYFDNLRIRLKALIENHPRTRSAESKTARQVEYQARLTDQLQAVELLNIRRSKAYFDLYSKINNFIKEATIEDATRLKLFNMLEKHHVLYSSLFSPHREKPNGESAVLIAWPGNAED
jgi:hypothetical protein